MNPERLWWHTRGFKLVPIRYGDKKPAIEEWKPIAEQKTQSDEDVEKLFPERMRLGTAAIVPENIVVLDFENLRAAQLAMEKIPELSETLRIRTGNGEHAYCMRSTAKNLELGMFSNSDGVKQLEIRVSNPDGAHYNLVPPSLHPNGTNYAFVNKTEPKEINNLDWKIFDFITEMKWNFSSDTHKPKKEPITPRRSASLFEEVKQRVTLKEIEPNAPWRGEEARWKCPKHGETETHPFPCWLNNEGYFRCHSTSCGERGDLIHYYALKNRLTDSAAAKRLAADYGIEEKKSNAVLEKPEPIPISGEKITIDEIHTLFREKLKIENMLPIDVIISTALYPRLARSSINMGLIVFAPSGSWKTTVVNSVFSSDYCDYLAEITKSSFITGWESTEKKIVEDYAPKMAKKYIVTNDFSSIQEMQKDSKGEIFSQIRQLFDGSISKRYGTGKVVSYTKIYPFYWIICAVPQHFNDILGHQILGSRFLNYKLPSDFVLQHDIKQKAWENVNDVSKINAEINFKVVNFLRQFDKLVDDDFESIKQKIFDYSEWLCIFRANGASDPYTGELVTYPEPEKPTRIIPFLRMTCTLVKTINPAYTDNELLSMCRNIVFSSIDPIRLKILKYVFDHPESSTNNIREKLSLGTKTVKYHLWNLKALGVVDVVSVANPTPFPDHYWEIAQNPVVDVERLLDCWNETKKQLRLDTDS